jgi:hypothetical protein
MRTRRWIIATLCSALLPTLAAAQTATFGGAIVRDTLGHGVSGVLVALIGLNRSDTTDARGEFKFDGLPAGRVVVTVRKVGFQVITDSVVLVKGENPEREYVLEQTVVALSSVKTMASATEPVAESSTPARRFAEHAKNSPTGRFVSDSVLRLYDSQHLSELLVSRVPGLRVYHPDPVHQSSAEYLGSARSSCDGPVFSCGNGSPCPVTLYLDGAVVFNPSEGRMVAATRAPPPVDGLANPSKARIDAPFLTYPDLTRILVRDLTGVEFYAGGTTAPAEYSVTTTCGLLSLWTRTR